MRLKCRPEDFVVRERIAWEPQERGPYGIYRLTKVKESTFSALRKLARAANVPLADIGYAGLKDRQALASQLVSIPGRKRIIRDDTLTVDYLGRGEQPISRELLQGNNFDVVIRDLGRDDVKHVTDNATVVRTLGLPNYFDKQRFECRLPNGDFVARRLLTGDYEGALRGFLAEGQSRSGERHETADYLMKHWGEWERCRKRFSRRRVAPLLKHLEAFPADFAGAFALVNPDLFLLHLYAFQSHIWNLALGRLVRRLVPRPKQFELPYELGAHVCYREIDRNLYKRLRAIHLPLPDHTTRCDDADARAALKDAFKEVGLKQSEFLLAWPAPPPESETPRPDWDLREEPRKIVLQPQNLWLGEPEPDSMHKGRLCLHLRFQLPAGAYATLVMKRIAGDPGVFDKPRRPREPREPRERREPREQREPRSDRPRRSERPSQPARRKPKKAHRKGGQGKPRDKR